MFFYWTIIKITPYIISLIGGVLLAYLLSKSKRKIRFIRFFIWIIPFCIYFALNPIYEGDFSNNYRELKSNKGFVQFKQNQLIIITIPDCPYCFASIKKIKQLKKRIPKLNVKYLVCSKNKHSINSYKKEINGNFPIDITTNTNEWVELSKGSFPSYLFISKKSMRIWSNDNFGTLALDELERSSY